MGTYMAWFDGLRSPKIKRKKAVSKTSANIWTKCLGCNEILYRIEIDRNFNICPRCGYHFAISLRRWIELLIDEGTFQEEQTSVSSGDPLKFKDIKPYKVRIKEASKNSGEREAFVYGHGKLAGVDVILGVFSFQFMGGSMGSVVGEKITMAFELAEKRKLPIIIVSASGGARMQEGLMSIMQMAKTVIARERLRETATPFISLLTHPTTGGVAASFAMLGDFAISEPGALIGFAGPRVIEQTTKQKLPENFQRASFLLEHGMIDQIVKRNEIKDSLASLLDLLGFAKRS